MTGHFESGVEMEDIKARLNKYGADPKDFRSFDQDEPGLLPYASLVATRSSDGSQLRALCGVYEWQSNPLVFVVDGQNIRDDSHFCHIRRCVALRGDAPYLAVFRPGHLTIHRIALDNDGSDATQVKTACEEDVTVFPLLANSRPGLKTATRWISQVVLKLLKDTIAELQRCGLAGNDAISLAGRALFLRFLADRNLFPNSLGKTEQAFDNSINAITACRWLDRTFNGDLLPVSYDLFDTLPREVFFALGNILRKSPDAQLYLGWEEKWDYLDFAHIPVGVLSEAYEQYMREDDPKKQRSEGSYYTPRAIVDFMVSAAFHGLRREGIAHEARVLDPAVGAGVYLVATFRQLVAERWAHYGRRPETLELREILYQQITGFDINEAALRFSALGLYLMSIELDPEPEPVEKLKFQKNLHGSVLFDLSSAEDGLGSLGTGVSSAHHAHYDLVIGNPPWSRSTRLLGWKSLSKAVGEIAQKRLPNDKKFKLLPKEVMDLPFIWRAMQWAKPSGVISFALHARVLFLQGDGMMPARSALFRAIEVTGVLNGADMCGTRVWPAIAVPFCLFFAKNHLPAPGAAFHFVSPRRESLLNSAGAMRVDTANSEIVTASQVAKRPEILKILYRGGRLDLEIYDRMVSRGVIPLSEYWEKLFGMEKGRVGNGYQKLRESSRTRKGENSDGLPGVSAAYLHGIPELTTSAANGLFIDTDKLPIFNQKRIHDPRPRSLFRKPLLLVRESPPGAAGRINVALAEDDVVFNQSFNGYSAAGHDEGVRLLRYLTLLISSKPAMWHALITSGRFGVERRVLEKMIIDSIPVVDYEGLRTDLKNQIDSLFAAVSRNNTSVNWAKVDDWAAEVYGIGDKERLIISDTLRFNMPFSKHHVAAQTPPRSGEILAFCRTVKEELTPWAEREHSAIKVEEVTLPADTPWKMIQVYALNNGNADVSPQSPDWPTILRLADNLAATEVMYPDPSSCSLVVARLNQARYWSVSQALLASRQIVWEHLSVLFGEDAE